MKALLAGIAWLLISLTGLAQDQLLQRNGKVLSGKIISINPLEVTFRPDSGYAKNMLLTEIRALKHQSGYCDLVNRRGEIKRCWRPTVQLREKYHEHQSLDYRVNYFHLGVGNFFFRSFSLSYERLLDQGKLGIKIPIMVNFRDVYSFDNDYAYAEDKRAFSYGVDLNFYPGRQGFIRFFTGMGVRFGEYEYSRNYRSGNNEYKTENGTTPFQALLFNNGLMIRPFTWLAVNAVVGLGVSHINNLERDEYGNVRSVNRIFIDPQLNLTIGL